MSSMLVQVACRVDGNQGDAMRSNRHVTVALDPNGWSILPSYTYLPLARRVHFSKLVMNLLVTPISGNSFSVTGKSGFSGYKPKVKQQHAPWPMINLTTQLLRVSHTHTRISQS